MGVCDVCGNDYEGSFSITRGDKSGVYDSIECAVVEWAPSCTHCGCRILGHGVDLDGSVFCCSHCAREAEGVDHSDQIDATSST